MERTIDLGMSAIPIRGFHRHLEITIYFGGQSYRKEDEGYFSVMGLIGRGCRRISCGQNLDEIRAISKKKYHTFLDELLSLHKKHHLKYCKCISENDAKRIKENIEKGY